MDRLNVVPRKKVIVHHFLSLQFQSWTERNDQSHCRFDQFHSEAKPWKCYLHIFYITISRKGVSWNLCTIVQKQLFARERNNKQNTLLKSMKSIVLENDYPINVIEHKLNMIKRKQIYRDSKDIIRNNIQEKTSQNNTTITCISYISQLSKEIRNIKRKFNNKTVFKT